MRKVRKVAVLVAALGSVGLLAAGTAHADGHGRGHGGDHVRVEQSSTCKSHDLNVDILGQIGVLDGVLGNVINGEGNSGGQDSTHLGSSMGCDNSVS